MEIQKFKQKLKENLELKIIAIILAIILWVYSIGQQKSEIIFNIPIKFETNQNMILYDKSTDFVTLNLRGQQNVIRGLSKSQFRITIDLKNNHPGTVEIDISNKNIFGPKDVEIIDIFPNKLTAKLDYLVSKNVHIKVITQGELPKKYHIEKLITEPEIISIEGIKSKINKIKYIETSPILLKGAKLGFTNIVRLQKFDDNINIKGPQEIKVIVLISREETIEVPIKVINYSHFKANTYPSDLKIVIYADNALIESFINHNEDLFVLVNASGIKKGTYFIKDFILSNDKVKLIKSFPSEVKLILE
ncbi:MAG: hypothetical protein HY934_07965 [Candidatus Firestonebacteria bacterium]|nr:hypothetical protein [Candidatus Firestonebacteria bacterium]